MLLVFGIEPFVVCVLLVELQLPPQILPCREAGRAGFGLGSFKATRFVLTQPIHVVGAGGAVLWFGFHAWKRPCYPAFNPHTPVWKG